MRYILVVYWRDIFREPQSERPTLRRSKIHLSGNAYLNPKDVGCCPTRICWRDTNNILWKKSCTTLDAWNPWMRSTTVFNWCKISSIQKSQDVMRNNQTLSWVTVSHNFPSIDSRNIIWHDHQIIQKSSDIAHLWMVQSSPWARSSATTAATDASGAVMECLSKLKSAAGGDPAAQRRWIWCRLNIWWANENGFL